MTVEVKVDGLDGVMNGLNLMCAAVRTRILKKAVSDAGVHIVEAAKAACPEGTGTLRDSITMKIKADGKTAYCLIGPKTGIKVPVRVVTKGKNKGLVLIAVPTYYAHLVEFGHEVIVGGKNIGFAGPRPFMRTAWDEYGGEVALFTIVETLRKEIDTELDKTFRYKW